ncbi:MAG TPA: VanZ family protein [Polyangia bacterium]|nr:VanZ family protein [Polyangia bacterium]
MRTTARFRRRLWAWGPAVLWAAVIFVLSSLSANHVPILPGQTDKLVHGTVYAILGALCFRAIAMTWTWPHRPAIAIATLLALLYGVTDEIHQTFTPGRTPDWRDALADMIGGLVGALVFAAVSRSRGPRREESRQRDG